MKRLPVYRCQHDTFSAKCREQATRALRSPDRSAVTRYYCDEHATLFAERG